MTEREYNREQIKEEVYSTLEAMAETTKRFSPSSPEIERLSQSFAEIAPIIDPAFHQLYKAFIKREQSYVGPSIDRTNLVSTFAHYTRGYCGAQDD